MDPVYHVTLAGNLGGIQSHGLVPGSGGKFGGGYAGHSRGRLFLTEPEGVYFWLHRIAATVTPIEGADEVPVVLRFEPTAEEEEAMQDDELGTRDAGAGAYFLGTGVESDRLEVWTGDGWYYLDEVDPQELIEDIEAGAEVEEDDGEEWLEFDDEALLPGELHPNPSALPPGFEGFGFDVDEESPVEEASGRRAFVDLKRGDEFRLEGPGRHQTWRVVQSQGDYSKWVEKADQKGRARQGYAAVLASLEGDLVQVFVAKPGGAVVPDRTKLRDEGYMP